MDPLTPTTSTLAPAISHIAETAATLSNDLTAHIPVSRSQDAVRQSKERQTVQWVLEAPERLEQLLEAGKKDEAAKDWDTVKGLLDSWQGVEGVEDIKEACQKTLTSVYD